MSQYYQQGLDKALAKDYPGAIEAFEMALISNPNWAEVYYRRGLVYFDLGDNLASVADYTRSIELQPQQKDAYYGRALVRLILKNFSGATTDVDQAILYGRDFAPNYQLKGIICQKLARRNDAMQAYKLAASLYLKQQDLANSRACLAKAEELSPYNNQVAHIPLGVSYASAIAKAENGQLWEASQEADSLVRANPQDAKAYCCRGVIHQMRDNLPAALLDFNTAIHLDPAVHTAYRHRGRMRQKMGDLQGAIDDFTQAIVINPKDGEIQVFLSQIHLAKGDNLQALNALEQAVQLTPHNPAVYMERAQFHAKTEELSTAQADYQTAANLYLEQHDLANYQVAVDKLKNLQQIRPAAPTPSSPAPNSGNKDLRQRLLRLVGGQWPIAEAMIQRYRDEYPGYDDDWYLEQTISYVERGL
jgi:tetratricopeptide (TPR) repeat protein